MQKQNSKYGLQLRVKPSSSQRSNKTQPQKPPLPPPFAFRDDGDDDVEDEIARQAFKNKSLKDVEEQHKKALEEDPSVFDYDGVYDEMKEKIVRPKLVDRSEKKSKYIELLMHKAKEREQEHEIIYERKLAKERSKEEDLYKDKDKYVTSAYKKKLAEREKWMEEERLRKLREEKDDVTKKSDISDFYFNLSKNVAFGANDAKSKKPVKQGREVIAASSEEPRPSASSPAEPTRGKQEREEVKTTAPEETRSPPKSPLADAIMAKDENQGDSSPPSKNLETSDSKIPVSGAASVQDNIPAEQQPVNQTKSDHHKRDQDAVAIARERYLARKRAKVVE